MPDPSVFRATEPAPLLAFLKSALPGCKGTTLRRYLREGRVRVNGEIVSRGVHALAPGDEIRVEASGPPPAAALPARIEPGGRVRLVYQDDWLLVAEKPAGWLAVPEGPNSPPNVLDYLRRRLAGAGRGRAKSGAPLPPLHRVHRLDRFTSGLLILARTAEARAWFLDHWDQVEKRYLAVVAGAPHPPEGELRCYLAEDARQNVRRVEPGAPGAQLAITHYATRRVAGRFALLELRLETGRRNQIRVQLADLGHPVVGDRKYGGADSPEGHALGRQALHAWRLSFPHPATGNLLRLESPFPAALARLVRGGAPG